MHRGIFRRFPGACVLHVYWRAIPPVRFVPTIRCIRLRGTAGESYVLSRCHWKGNLMAVHWVNYDLNKTGQNYDGLIEYLTSIGAWAKPLKSSFLVDTNLSVSEVRDGAAKHIDSNDCLLVMRVDGDNWASWGLLAEVTDWMKERI